MKSPTITSLLSAVLMTNCLLGAAITVPAVAADSIEQQVYRSDDFGRVAQQVRNDLRRQGYQVMNIKADDYQHKPALEVYAKKNHQAYELKYSYPDLKLLESKQKSWSQLWQDDHQPDAEDRIKKSIYNDPTFDSIKTKAVQKLKDLSYEIEEIEADDYKQKPILKVDANRGDDDYEIKLSYPSLDILTVEEE